MKRALQSITRKTGPCAMIGFFAGALEAYTEPSKDRSQFIPLVLLMGFGALLDLSWNVIRTVISVMGAILSPQATPATSDHRPIQRSP